MGQNSLGERGEFVSTHPFPESPYGLKVTDSSPFSIKYGALRSPRRARGGSAITHGAPQGVARLSKCFSWKFFFTLIDQDLARFFKHNIRGVKDSLQHLPSHQRLVY